MATRKRPRSSLADSTLEQLKDLHSGSVRLVVAAEAMTLHELDQALDRVHVQIDSNIVQRVEKGDESEAFKIIRQQQGSLRDGFAVAALISRRRARQLSRAQVATEAGAVRQLNRPDSKPPDIPPAPTGTSLDDAMAQSVGGSMVAAWTALSLEAVRRWRRAGETPTALARRLRGVRRRVQPRLRRHAATQTLDAYNHEHREFWRKPPTEVGLPEGWEATSYNVWTAVLDRETCPFCASMDGQMVPVGKPFIGDAETPAHPNCRCIEIVVFVPELARPKLPGLQIDYQELKADVADYFRGSSLSVLGKRHASDFILSTIAVTSPETLTRKLLNRRGYAAAH